MVSGKQDGKMVCLPTQLYDVTSGRVSEKFVLTIYEDLDDIQGQKWNAKRVIIFRQLFCNVSDS